ncbi:hypothetical protein TIFTF001_024543 [Ficus carica]|uniref:Uncharacterized protein n=1 Tax=Ficus carica TaxID=3494 RepID=A0AA88DGX4_FICCA|nr:hypothetical protein TIFTF001_024543 [Ficus carica]
MVEPQVPTLLPFCLPIVVDCDLHLYHMADTSLYADEKLSGFVELSNIYLKHSDPCEYALGEGCSGCQYLLL